MNWIILSIIIIFYSSYYIKLLYQKRSGIKTNILGQGEKKKSVIYTEIALKILTLIAFIIHLYSVILLKNINISFLYFVSLLLLTLGTLLLIISMVTMRNNWRAGISTSNETALVVNGIYKYSRNPAFLGFDIFYIGMTISYPSIINILLLLLLLVVFDFQIRNEEKELIKLFGNEYLNYKKSVRRYLGIYRNHKNKNPRN